jgi:hypothetical protein
MLGRLSCVDEAIGAIDITSTWHADFLARFANVPRDDRAPVSYVPFADNVTTSSEIIPYYHLNHSFWSLSDNKESSR